MLIVSYQNRVFNNQGYVFACMQLAMSIILELVFYLCSIVFLPIPVVNNSVMNAKIGMMPWLPNMHQLKLLTVCWRSFSGCRREHVGVVFASKGCHYLMNGCLQPIGTYTGKNDLTRRVTHREAVFATVIHSIFDAWHYERPMDLHVD